MPIPEDAEVPKGTECTGEPAIRFPPPDGFVRLMGRLTAFVNDTRMALVEISELFGSRQLDMRNSA